MALAAGGETGRSQRLIKGVVGLALLLSAPVLAAGRSSERLLPRRTNEVLTVAPRTVLPEVQPTELTRGASLQAVSIHGGFADAPRVVTTVTRVMPGVWELRLPSDFPLERLSVGYEMVSPDGVRHRLSTASAERGEIPVRIHPTPPEIVRREGRTMIVRGGVVLELSVGSLRQAGRFSGSLNVTVDRF